MNKLTNIVDTIKEIECPVDRWESKVVEAYREYAADDEYEVTIDRDEAFDERELKAYTVHSNYPDHDEVVVLVSEGEDGYVANVEDAYIK